MYLKYFHYLELVEKYREQQIKMNTIIMSGGGKKNISENKPRRKST